MGFFSACLNNFLEYMYMHIQLCIFAIFWLNVNKNLFYKLSMQSKIEN